MALSVVTMQENIQGAAFADKVMAIIFWDRTC
jgi:hypothetical protein